MEKEASLKMTELDCLTLAPHMQMIKAALPYIHVPEQRFFSLMIKFSELERTLRLFEKREGEAVGICSLSDEDPASPIDMLSAMKPYGTEEEQDLIELMINFMQGSRLSQSYREAQRTEDRSSPEDPTAKEARRPQNNRFPLEQLKIMLPPEQQSRLETAQLLMQAFQQSP